MEGQMRGPLAHPRRPDDRCDHGTRLRRHRRSHPLHLLVQPEPHADEPVQGGVGVDEGVEGLVALAVALGLPGADGAPAFEAAELPKRTVDAMSRMCGVRRGPLG